MNIGEMNIVITGAAGGVGSHLFDYFHKNAQSVFGIIHRANPKMVENYGNLFIVADLLNKPSVDQAFQSIQARFGTIHVLINTVGGFHHGKPIEQTRDEWVHMYKLNFMTVLHSCQSMIPIMKKQGMGHILNFGAQVAMEGMKEAGPYCVSKVMVHTLTKTIAKESAGAIKSNAIVPWTMDTPKNRKSFPGASYSGWTSLEKITAKVVGVLESEESGKLKFI